MGNAGLQLVAVVLPLTLLGQTAAPPGTSSAPSRFADERRLEDMHRWREEMSLAGTASDLASWTPAEVAIWSDLVARTHLTMAKDRYDLTPEQETAVQRRLDQLKAEAHAYWTEHLAEYQGLRKDIKKIQGAWNDPVAREERQALSRRCGELMKGQPLHFSMVFPRIEELLPAAQVEASREKRRPPSPSQREEMAREMFFLREQAQEMAFRTPEAPGLERLQDAASNTLFPWKEYVALFIRVYDLDEAQQTTARSILGELQARRDQYQQAHREEFQALRNTEDQKKRSRMFAELSPPIQEMFDELKTRQDRIPRPAQREAAAQRDVEGRKVTTRPAGPASRPVLPPRSESAAPTEPRP